jgi:hypothetical protein
VGETETGTINCQIQKKIQYLNNKQPQSWDKGHDLMSKSVKTCVIATGFQGQKALLSSPF